MSTADTTTKHTELLDRVRSVLHAQRVRKWSSLVAIQPHGSRVPVFGVHPINGEVYFYHRLAPLLGPEQPVYALRARGLDGKTEPLSRIEDMAAAYLREIAQVQPHGPYIIIGRCNGSRVAFEMAQQLTRAGKSVALLCLIDPGPIPVPLSPAQRVADLARYVRYHASRGRLGRAVVRSATPRARRVRARLIALRARVTGAPARAARTPLALRRTKDLLRDVLTSSQYREQAYVGRVLFFSAADALRHEASHHSWKGVAELDLRHVPGDHRTIASPANLSILAQQLRCCLDDLSAETRGADR